MYTYFCSGLIGLETLAAQTLYMSSMLSWRIINYEPIHKSGDNEYIEHETVIHYTHMLFVLHVNRTLHCILDRYMHFVL